MNDREAIDMMQRCLQELRSLHAQIEHLDPRGYRRDHKTGGTHQWQTTPNYLRLYPPPTRPNQKRVSA